MTNSGTSITKFVTVTAVTGTSERADGSVKKEISTIIVPNGTPASRWKRRTTRWVGTPRTPTL
ncbi:hypothetical protein NHF46_05465 [Arthrobacter alpinus]|nr:hypothetical protein [Arthrobacter alpinus]